MTCSGCTSLEEIAIPKTAVEIRDGAFDNCTSLKKFYCYSTDVPLTSNKWGQKYEIFGPMVDLSKATLYVPESSIEKYKADTPWSKFGTILPLSDDETRIDASSIDKIQHMQYYTIGGSIHKFPKSGIYIVKKSNGEIKKVILK